MDLVHYNHSEGDFPSFHNTTNKIDGGNYGMSDE